MLLAGENANENKPEEGKVSKCPFLSSMKSKPELEKEPELLTESKLNEGTGHSDIPAYIVLCCCCFVFF